MKVNFATPRFRVLLYKSIMRKPGEAGLAVSDRYAAKDAYIDLTPYLGDGSAISTSKDVRQPSGSFTLTFADRPSVTGQNMGPVLSTAGLESVYGLVEPMDIVEIRLWNGRGMCPNPLPIKMRGFVTEIVRGRQIGPDGKPLRTVTVSGQDYGKVLQAFQILYMPSYSGSTPLLSGFNFFEQFGMTAQNTISGADFIQAILDKLINPQLDTLIPQNSPMPRVIKADIQTNAMMNNSYMAQEGAVFDLLRSLLDIGHWNELYVEDREDGVYLVWRPVPAFDLTTKEATQPLTQQVGYGKIGDNDIVSVRQSRSDEAVYNYFWSTNQRFDMVDDNFRKVEAFMSGAPDSMMEYPNTAHKYYGLRAMYADSVMGPMEVDNQTSGLPEAEQTQRGDQMTDWITERRKVLINNNKDNVVLEKGSIDLKGGPTRFNSTEPLKAGDYVSVLDGLIQWTAYAVSLQDNFQPYRSYTSNIQFERGTGFAERVSQSSGNSPWLKEQAMRGLVAGNDIGSLVDVDPRLVEATDWLKNPSSALKYLSK
ncbi:hypothetical protein EX011_21390 [Salmonella enterica]|nr:hypothetical protein [Salmonella enterica]EBL7042079.1 hypothetical protein [Salmonella enterica]